MFGGRDCIKSCMKLGPLGWGYRLYKHRFATDTPDAELKYTVKQNQLMDELMNPWPKKYSPVPDRKIGFMQFVE